MHYIIKRIIPIVLIIILVIGVSVQAFAQASDYKDISNSWAQGEITDLINQRIMDGYGDNTIKPDNLISRAEFAKILVTALGLSSDNESEIFFNDVKQTDWFYEPITILKKMTIIDGYSDGSFKPNKNISRAEMIAMIVRTSRNNLLLNGKIKVFKDINIQHWAYKDVLTASRANLIAPLGGNYLKPDELVTRAEVAYSIEKMLWDMTPLKDIDEQGLTDFASNYSKLVNTKYNNNDSNIDDLVKMSYGGQIDAMNVLSRTIALYKRMGITTNRTFTLSNPKFIVSSNNLAQISFNYISNTQTSLKTGVKISTENGLSIYSLIKVNGIWLIYNEKDTPISKSGSNSNKLNLTWDQLGTQVDTFRDTNVSGLDIISPTWFDLADTSGNFTSIASQKYIMSAHNNGYKIWALASNNFDPDLTSQVLNTPSAMKTAVNQLVKFATDYNLDGINIDFENMNTSDKDMFTEFIRKLAVPLKQKGITLSVDVTFIVPNSRWSSCYDRVALSQIADYIAVMAYDQTSGGSQVSGSVAQIIWVENGLKKILQQVLNTKVLLGVPFYTRQWEEIATPNGIQVTSKALSMSNAEKIIQENNAQKIWDAESGQYYAQYEKNGVVYKIWLEDAQSISLKAQLVKKYNLAGIASWKAGFETPDIWNVLKTNLNK